MFLKGDMASTAPIYPRHANASMHCALSPKPLLFTLMNIGSSRKISYDLTAHCPSGPFPASRCISTCILFCFSITIHKHTMINMYCGTQKNRLIEQRRHL